ncbi:MAG TPA: adenylate/guanylate cyclase domain-containing protein [Burkholderiaceae bacterium]|nr:adenylate/guanylate cyclase domain-containing protein [Burkholderiaceae bacterium]
MKCAACASDNPDGHRFCGQCGSPLPLACPACGFANPPGHRFCGGCGAALAGAAPGAPAPAPAPVPTPAPALAPTPPAAAAMVEGRRQVTILFSDLTGFTELSSHMDAEDLHGIVQAYFDRAEKIVVGLGGSVERYVGDAVMAVFGARRAHDDDALRAVRAGFDIQAAMPELAARFGLALRCRVGLAAGEVVVMESRAGYAAEVTVVGQSVNLASRIQSLGNPGDVLASDVVHEQVERRVRATSLGKRELKGIDQPVRIWRIDALVEEDAGAHTPFVGRAVERAQLQASLERVRRERRATGVLVRGEAGIGKTRLLEAFAQMARDAGWQVHGARFLDFGFRRGAEGLHGLACSLLGIDAVVADATQRQRAAQDAIDRGALPEHLLPMLFELLSAGQTEASRKLFDAMDAGQRERALRAAVSALVSERAARAPLMVLMEDVHWADPRDIERLAELARTAAAEPLLMALGSRPVDDAVRLAWRSQGQEDRLEQIDLEPLDAADMRALGGSFAGVSATVLEGCIERSGGNPLFLEQLLRHASESGQASLPASIRSLVLARMDLLSPAASSTLQAAAVLGQRFELAALRALVPDPEAACEELVRVHMLAGGGAELQFVHALIHEAAYASMLKRNARELHLQAADWYLAHDLSLRARHLDRAESPEAARAYLAAAVEAIERGRYEAAQGDIARGLEVARESGDRIALRLQQGQLLHDTGRIPDSMAVYRQALDEAEDDVQRVRAWIGLAAGMRLADDLDGALDALARAQALAETSGAALDAERARLHYLRGGVCFPRGDIDGCRREHGLALEAARRAGLPRAEADALSGLGDAAYASGRMKSAYESFDACMRLCAAHGFGRIEAANRFMVATARIYFAEFDGALVDALESAELARRVGHQRAEIVSRLTAGWILITLGRFDEARREGEAGLAVAAALGAARFKPFLMEGVARVERALGQAEAAERSAREALALAREGKLMRFIGPWLLATRALCDRDAAERRAALDEGAQLLAEGCVGHNYLNFYAQAIDASFELHDAPAIARWCEGLERYMAAEPHPWGEFHLARGRALMAWLRDAGDGAARRQVQSVRDDAERLGFRCHVPSLQALLGPPGAAR